MSLRPAGMLLLAGDGLLSATPPAGPAPTFNQIVSNTGTASVATATFGSTPTTGDWLIAVMTITAGVYTPTAGWTAVEVISPCAIAPSEVILYHKVVGGDGTAYSPTSDTQAGTWALSIVDVTSGNSTWAALLQQIASDCAGTNTVTVSGNGPLNTGVFAVGYINVATSGSLSADPTMTGVTGSAQASHVNGGGGSAAGIIGAETVLAGADPITVSATPTGAGTNMNEALAVLIFLNPG